jgi:hypothetical protein
MVRCSWKLVLEEITPRAVALSLQEADVWFFTRIQPGNPLATASQAASLRYGGQNVCATLLGSVEAWRS